MSKRVRKTSIRSRHSFTLVELIVVLVILAVLAAILVPSLTGYIKKAKKDQYYEEAHYALVAAQSTIVECYGRGYVSQLGIANHGGQQGGGGSAGDRRWDIGKGSNATDEEKEYGEKLLKLFDRTRDNEPYLLIFGCGRPEMGLADSQLYTVYYIGYVANKNAPAIFFINGEWRYKYPTDNPEIIYKDDGKTVDGKSIKINYLKVGSKRDKKVDIPIQYYVVSNNTGIADNFWTNGADSLRGHSEGQFKG